MKNYLLKLKVSKPDGQPIFAEVKYFNGLATIRIKKLFPLEDDEFVKDNKIVIQNIKLKDFQETINKLTNYLESKMLESMSKGEKKNADRNPSNGNKPNSRRNEESDSKRDSEEPKKRSTPSVYTGTRGSKPTKGSGEGSTDTEVAESGNPSVS